MSIIGEETTTNQEDNNRNANISKRNSHLTPKYTYKRRIEYLEDATCSCGYHSDVAKFGESTKVIIRYVISKYKAGL